MVECEFCGTKLSSKNNLRTHQSRTKYCLDLQKGIDKSMESKPLEFCQYCNKNFQSKQGKCVHESTCVEKIILERIKGEVTDIKISHEKEIADLKMSRDKEISDLKIQHERETKEIYEKLFNKDQECIVKLAEKSSVTTTTNTIKNKNIVMNTLNLSAERLESLKDTYNMAHYEAGGRGQVEWLVPNVLTDENGNLVYGCGDISRKNFFYYDKGNKVADLHAETLKAAIRPIMDIKLKEYKKAKCRELAEIEDEDESNAAMEKFNSLYKENKGLGVEFEKRLVEMTYRR